MVEINAITTTESDTFNEIELLDDENLKDNYDDYENLEDNLSIIEVENEHKNLDKLLTEWNLGHLLVLFIDQKITLNSLKEMKREHIDQLFESIELGDKIIFEAELVKWQNSHKTTANSSKSASSFVLLKNILSDPKGELILKFYVANGNKLSSSVRKNLADLIIDFYIKNQLEFNMKICRSIAEQIIETFPTEKQVMGYYFLPVKGRSPKGILYNKYQNEMCRMRKMGLVPSKQNKLRLDSAAQKRSTEFSKDPEAIKAKEEVRIWLVQHREASIWADIKPAWESCWDYREHQLTSLKNENYEEIFLKWPLYTHSLGYDLIDMDFSKKFRCANSIYGRWEMLTTNIITVFENHVRQKPAIDLIAKLKDSNLTNDGRNLIILTILHALFVPTAKKVTRDESGKKNHIKYSIKDSQESFVIIKRTFTEAKEEISAKQADMCPIQPLMIVLGTMFEPKEFIVYFNKKYFKLYSILKALDVCFKTVHLFNLKYPDESSMVWHFLQLYIYNIETPYDMKYPLIKVYCKELEDLKDCTKST